MGFQHSSAPFHHFKASHGTHENNQGHVRCTSGLSWSLVAAMPWHALERFNPQKTFNQKRRPECQTKKNTHMFLFGFSFSDLFFFCAPKPRRHPSTLIWCDVTKLTSHPRSSPVAVGCSQPALVSSLKGQKCRDAPPQRKTTSSDPQEKQQNIGVVIYRKDHLYIDIVT